MSGAGRKADKETLPVESSQARLRQDLASSGAFLVEMRVPD